VNGLKLATYIDQLTEAGVDPKIATAHAKALEATLEDKFVTKDFLAAQLSDQTAQLYKALLLQTVTLGGLMLAILKLAH
jgi:hypothetical protein